MRDFERKDDACEYYQDLLNLVEIEVTRLSRQLRALRRRAAAEHRNFLEEELYQALKSQWTGKAHELAAKLASTGVGVRRIRYGRLRCFVPSFDECSEQVVLPASEHGFAATIVPDLDKATADYVFSENPSKSTRDANELFQDAKIDFKETMKRLLHSPRGRAAPRGVYLLRSSCWPLGQTYKHDELKG